MTLWTVVCQAICPWDFSDKKSDTKLGCHFLLQGVFLTQGSNPHLLHCREILYPLNHSYGEHRQHQFPSQTTKHKSSQLPNPKRAQNIHRWVIGKQLQMTHKKRCFFSVKIGEVQSKTLFSPHPLDLFQLNGC